MTDLNTFLNLFARGQHSELLYVIKFVQARMAVCMPFRSTCRCIRGEIGFANKLTMTAF